MKSLFSEMAALKEKHYAATTGLGTKYLSSFVMGEKQVVDEYDGAIVECSSDRELVATLTRQKDTLLAKIAEMERIQT